MQFDRLNRKLEGITDASKKGKCVKDLFQLMTNNKEIWFEAYANIYSNKGAITKGVNDNTLDGFSEERIEGIMERLKQKRYRFAPVKRVYIPKRNSSKKRPLGVPTGDDKLVQEVVRILLERIYEPIFSEHAHGFRPNRSCHTALEHIRKKWTAIKWFIEFDIKSFFDSMCHPIMISLLEKKIDDKQFIKLICCMLKAGYLEEWKYYPTYSGTPQGGIVSPILSGIYLHELDCFVEQLAQQFRKGKRRRRHPEYRELAYQKVFIRKEIDRIGRKPHLMKQLRELDGRQKTLPYGEPFDEKFRRLRYCRYADDFILGVIGSKDETREIMQQVEKFIADTLNLQVSPEKTGICSGEEGITFLSYRISTDRSDKVIRTKSHGRYIRQRTVNDNIRLDIPSGKSQEFCQRYGYGDWDEMKPTHRCKLAPLSDEEIICVYNAELRGLANYYCLAKGMKHYLNRLEFMSRYSLFKTFAYKYKTTVSKVAAKFRKRNEFIRDYEVKGKRYQMKVFKLAYMDNRPKDWNVDEIPNTLQLYAPRSELVKRLNYKVCEYCGNTEPPFETHHVRKVKDLSEKKHLARWEWLMVTRNRKTLVLCRKCHKDLHIGKLPDSRYQGNT
jgi:group II intron reverse transcriptase/maturase